jgi:hypothetical protein
MGVWALSLRANEASEAIFSVAIECREGKDCFVARHEKLRLLAMTVL